MFHDNFQKSFHSNSSTEESSFSLEVVLTPQHGRERGMRVLQEWEHNSEVIQYAFSLYSF